MSDFYLGIDVGNSNSELSVFDADCDCVYADNIPTLAEPFWREALCLFKGQQLHAAFEIGTHYPWLCKLLKEYCVEVVVVNAQEFEVISKAQYKSDKVDAPKLAIGLWRGDLPEVLVPEARVQEDRRLVNHVHELSRQTSRLKTRLRDILYAARMRCPYTNLWGLAGKTWLSEALPKLDPIELRMATQIVAQLKLLEAQRAELDKLVEQRVQSYPDAALAQSIPGFGPLVVLATLSAMVEHGRFVGGDYLSSYFGLCGRLHQSGMTRIQGPITKHGNKHVRWLLGQAVTHLIRKDPKVRKKYLKIRRRKCAKVARVAIMRWITTILWQMLSKKQPYRINGVAGNHLARKPARKTRSAKTPKVSKASKRPTASSNTVANLTAAQ